MTLRTRIKLALTVFTLFVALGVLGFPSGRNAEAIYCCEDCQPDCGIVCANVCCTNPGYYCDNCMSACESEYERCSTHCVYCNS
jgi:hypothetical protein